MAKLSQSLSLQQTLRMTPQLQQAIKLLQLSRMELETEVRKELEENPILEEVMELKEDDLKVTKEAAAEVEKTQEPSQDDLRRDDDFNWENYYEANSKPLMQNSHVNDEIMNYENVMTMQQTLHDYLHWQVKMAGFNEEEEKLATILIDYMDDDGYIKTDFAQIAEDEQVTVQDLEETLPFVQEFDPPGVGARDLKECLIIQARHLEEDTHDLVTLIQNHLKDLEKKHFDAISKTMNIPVGDVHELCKIIYTMEPKPGRSYAVHDVHYVTPDVYIYKVGDDYLVSLNEDGLPRLRVSNLYKNVMKGSSTTTKENDPKAHEYIQDKLRSAIWLIKSIHQRNRTIFKVSESIVKYQKDFFDKGPAFLKPMILRNIAEDIGMHESTVSRVTSSKYVHTPQGIFELKYFFNSGISSSEGDSLASEAVKLKIRDMVGREDPKKPLSDQQIVDMLKKEGLVIARRTVAKYRDVLRIQPSSRRKKVF